MIGKRRPRVLGAALTATALLAGCTRPPPPGDSVVPVNVTAVPIAAPPALSLTTEILQQARKFVFRPRNDSCLVTGTAFSTDGTIITNRHVAAGADEVDLSTWDGDDFGSTVAVHASTEDLNRLDGEPPDYVYATLATSDPTTGTKVWVAGYPEGNQLTVTSGSVLGSLAGSQFGLAGRILEISDPIKPGNSGSPLLNASGDVVGVVFAIDLRTHDGLAMPVSSLQIFLNSDGDGTSLPCAE